MQICQIRHVILEIVSQFSLKIFSAIKYNTSVLKYFGQRSQLKSKFFRFSSARVKIC